MDQLTRERAATAVFLRSAARSLHDLAAWAEKNMSQETAEVLGRVWHDGGLPGVEDLASDLVSIADAMQDEL